LKDDLLMWFVQPWWQASLLIDLLMQQPGASSF